MALARIQPLPHQSSYDPDVEYVAVGTARIDCAAAQPVGRAERARASQFLELGVTVNGTQYSKVYGPDISGHYGGMQGTGGLEAIYNPSTTTTTYLLNDTYGHAEATYKNGTLVWNTVRFDGYGVLPGSIAATPLSGTTDLASAIGWRGRYLDGNGFYNLGARSYVDGSFLTVDPLGHAASMDLYSFCNGDPVNNFDPTGRDAVDYGNGFVGFRMNYTPQNLQGAQTVFPNNCNLNNACAASAQLLAGTTVNRSLKSVIDTPAWIQGQSMYTLPPNGTMVATGWDGNGNYPSRRPSAYASAGQGGTIQGSINHTGFAYNVNSDGSFDLFADSQGAGKFTTKPVSAQDAANYNVVLAPSEQPYNSYKETGYVVASAISTTSATQSGNSQSTSNPFASIFNSIGNIFSGQANQVNSSSSPISKGGCGH